MSFGSRGLRKTVGVVLFAVFHDEMRSDCALVTQKGVPNVWTMGRQSSLLQLSPKDEIKQLRGNRPLSVCNLSLRLLIPVT